MYEIRVASVLPVGIIFFYFYVNGRSAESALTRAAGSLSRRTERASASSAETLLNQPARTRTRTQTVYARADLVLSHAAEVSLHVLALRHSSIQDVESGDQIIFFKKKSFPSFLPEDSRRASVSVPAPARSARSAFLARCHPRIEVSVEQQIRRKTHENSYITRIISLLWKKKNKAYQQKGENGAQKRCRFSSDCSCQQLQAIASLGFLFFLSCLIAQGDQQ